MFIKKKMKYFTRPEQISPDLSGDFRIVCYMTPAKTRSKVIQTEMLNGIYR